MNKLYFSKPTQGWFWDFNSGVYRPGIGFEEHIICSCGGVYEFSDVAEMAREDGRIPFFAYDDWINLGQEIYGGMYPVGMSDDNIKNSSIC